MLKVKSLRLKSKTKIQTNWTQGAVIYQIYPRSFQDSDDDGIGDIQGIIRRLDYLAELGVNGVWISPFYPSPMADFGYDVADYRDIDPLFGTLEDFKRLLDEAHKRNIKIIVDIVPNHTSDDHEWFRQSKRSRVGKYSDWYIWRDPKEYMDGKPIPPNNWLDLFAGNSAWEWTEERQQFYLHSFHKRQPDLNWSNPKVREAIKEVLRFWLRLGVDGFRVDAVIFLDKDPEFRDDPVNPNYSPQFNDKYDQLLHTNSAYWPKVYTYLTELSNVLKERPFNHQQRFMVTEGYVQRGGNDIVEAYFNYYRSMDPEVAAPFIFEGIDRPLEARDWHAFLRDFHAKLNEFSPNAVAPYAFGNHDRSRIATRYGEKRARAISVMMLTLPGIIFIYYGDELGMHDVSIPPKMIQDPGAAGGSGRDPERTPMQWSAGVAAGFSNNENTWLPLAHDYRENNVEVERKQNESFLGLYRALIEQRHKSKALSIGSMEINDNAETHIISFGRIHENERFSTILNLADEHKDYTFDLPGQIVISSLTGKNDNDDILHGHRLKPLEAILIKHIKS
jgi:alpha-glucosidase